MVALSPNRSHGSPKWVSAIQCLWRNRSMGENTMRTSLGFRLNGFATSRGLDLSEIPSAVLLFLHALSGEYGHFIAYNRLI